VSGRGNAPEEDRPEYPAQALIVYVALGMALGMVGWALFLH
jgi:hypothetical protein